MKFLGSVLSIIYCFCLFLFIISDNFLNAAKWVLSGYRGIFDLTEDEKSSIFVAVKARAAQSLIGAYYTVSLEPENREYLMSEASEAETILNLMAKMEMNEFLQFCL